LKKASGRAGGDKRFAKASKVAPSGETRTEASMGIQGILRHTSGALNRILLSKQGGSKEKGRKIPRQGGRKQLFNKLFSPAKGKMEKRSPLRGSTGKKRSNHKEEETKEKKRELFLEKRRKGGEDSTGNDQV